MRTKTLRHMRLAVVALVVIGAGLRVWAVEWNDRLQGDVNLFALTAREFVHDGALRYPIKYEYSDVVEYCEPRSTASQHPPLFPLLAGILGRIAGSDDTFAFLKLLSLAGGLTLLASVARRAVSYASPGTMTSLAFVGLSPALVDFSGNGSPYIWSGWFLLATTRLIPRAGRLGVRGWAGAGLLAGIAPQIHSSLAAIPVGLIVAGWFERERLSWREVGAFFATAGAAGAPYFAWNLRHFGHPLYSYNPHVLWTNLRAGQEGIWGDVVTWRWVDRAPMEIATQLVHQIGNSIFEMFEAISLDGSLAALALAIIGVGVSIRRSPRTATLVAIPIVLYLALVLLLPYRDRFGVPTLALAYVAAGAAIDAWPGVPRRAMLAGAGLALAWMITAYAEDSRTRYYQNDGTRRDAYEMMLPVAKRFALRPAAPTLGYSGTLTNGIEGAYVHRHPLVRGIAHGPPREDAPGDMARKLVRDFDVRYVWADAFTRAEVETFFPSAREIIGNGAYFVFELPAESAEGGVCGK